MREFEENRIEHEHIKTNVCKHPDVNICENVGTESLLNVPQLID